MKDKKTNSKIIRLLFIIVPIVLAGVLAALILFKVNESKNKYAEVEEYDDNGVRILKEDDDVFKMEYVGETCYKGGMSKYPELYSTPFKRSDLYIQNKTFIEGSEERVAYFQKYCVDFFDKMLNTPPEEIGENIEVFNAGLYGKMSLDFTEAQAAEGEDIPEFIDRKEYIERISQYIVDNDVTMEAEFKTDDSLVYQDVFYYVRGELIFTIYSNNDKDCEYVNGRKYSIPLDIALQADANNFGRVQIRAIGDLGNTNALMLPYSEDGDGSSVIMVY